MKEKKTDRRVIYTKKVIYDSLFELMKQKKLKDITVKELCITAGINRATFYTHFRTMDDLIDEMEAYSAQEIFNTLDPIWDGQDFIPFMFNQVVEYFHDHPIICELYSQGGPGGERLAREVTTNRNNVIDKWASYGSATEEQCSIIYDYLCNGTKQILLNWYIKGYQPEKEVIESALTGLFEKGLYAFVHEK